MAKSRRASAPAAVSARPPLPVGRLQFHNSCAERSRERGRETVRGKAPAAVSARPPYRSGRLQSTTLAPCAVGSAGVPALRVLYKKAEQPFIESQTAHPNRATFPVRAGTPALPTSLRTQYALNVITRPEIRRAIATFDMRRVVPNYSLFTIHFLKSARASRRRCRDAGVEVAARSTTRPLTPSSWRRASKARR